MIASPSAISSSTVNKLRPEKPCIAAIEPISFRLIDNPSSPLQGEIRSDPLQLTFPASKPLTDNPWGRGSARSGPIRERPRTGRRAWLCRCAPCSTSGDWRGLDVALGCDLDLDLRRGGDDFVDVEAASLL